MQLYYIQEKFSHGSLSRILYYGNNKFSLEFIQYTMYCIMKAVDVLHDKGCGLGDLTPQTIMLDEPSSSVKIVSIKGLRKIDKNATPDQKGQQLDQDYEKIIDIVTKLTTLVKSAHSESSVPEMVANFIKFCKEPYSPKFSKFSKCKNALNLEFLKNAESHKEIWRQ